jgi:phosphatidylserine/phosphatidylglycerophosphate/cardiolipin synthase-like enzyme
MPLLSLSIFLFINFPVYQFSAAARPKHAILCRIASAMATRQTSSKPARTLPKDEVVLRIEHRRAAFIDVIRSAKQRLLISLFRCTDFAILDAVADALNRNVEVRLLLTPRARGWEFRIKELGAYLESMGAKVRPYADAVVKYHAKYIVADDGPALIGSLNMTAKCFGASCDFILVTYDPGVVSGLVELFETDWRAPHSAFPSHISDRLIVGPDRARVQFTALLESAQRSIGIIDHKMDDPTLIALLKAKKAKGVSVQRLGAGQLGGLLPHGKLILVDGKTAAFGSMALSAMSLDFRREVAIMVTDPRCVRKLRDFFRFVATGGEVMDSARAAAFIRSPEKEKARERRLAERRLAAKQR